MLTNVHNVEIWRRCAEYADLGVTRNITHYALAVTTPHTFTSQEPKNQRGQTPSKSQLVSSDAQIGPQPYL